LPPYGFYWFVLADESQMPSWHIEPVQSLPELATLVIKHDMADLLKDACRRVLEREILPQWLAKRRWFSGSTDAGEPIRLRYAIPFCEQSEPCVLCEVTVGDAHYQLPLGYLRNTDTPDRSEERRVGKEWSTREWRSSERK